jgi:hypothetical protein
MSIYFSTPTATTSRIELSNPLPETRESPAASACRAWRRRPDVPPGVVPHLGARQVDICTL